MKQENIQKNIIHDERGLTLIEILGALTIMSVITVFLLGYLISATESSSDQNRRLIAVNLARLKVAEIREMFKDHAAYEVLLDKFVEAGSVITLNEANTLAGLDMTAELINGTYYRYRAELDIRTEQQPYKKKLDQAIGTDSRDYLIPIRVSVYWTFSDLESFSDRYSVTIPSYVTRQGGVAGHD